MNRFLSHSSSRHSFRRQYQHSIDFLHHRHTVPTAACSLVSGGTSTNSTGRCQPTLLWAGKVLFPHYDKSPCPGSIRISSNGTIEAIYPYQSEQEAKHLAATSLSMSHYFHNLGPNTILSPGLIDVHTHISELGRNWEGYYTATRAAAAGGITTLMGMPLNSLPPTTTPDVFQMECEAGLSKHLLADVGLWGGVLPDTPMDTLEELLSMNPNNMNGSNDGSEGLGGVFGIKAFLAPLPETAGYQAISPEQLSLVAELCGKYNVPLLIHCEYMTMEEVQCMQQQAFYHFNNDVGSHDAHIMSRPAQWEADAIRIATSLAEKCHIHIVHLSDANSLNIIRHAKRSLHDHQQQQLLNNDSNNSIINGRLTVETCPHYMLFHQKIVPHGDTRYKCFPPIRHANNLELLWSKGFGLGPKTSIPDNDNSILWNGGTATNSHHFHDCFEDTLIDIVASDHSPCEPEMRCMDSRNMKLAWGGHSGLQYQLPATYTAIYNRLKSKNCGEADDDDDTIEKKSIQLLCKVYSEHPSEVVPGLSRIKGSIQVGKRADLVAWDGSHEIAPNSYCQEHHRWKDTSVYPDLQLRGRVMGTWLGGVQVYDGEHDCFPQDERKEKDSESVGSILFRRSSLL